ncbi:MAG: serine/threonine protein kinase [Sedimentisphaerales bacterium]|nr:serine/threonine protein kinase [Sedimentisphaerales bacterium]
MCDGEKSAGGQRVEPEGLPTVGYGGSAIGPGAQIGPYKLLRILGEGGYGIVYLAEQQRPVKRRVALKVIKPGMDTKQVIARFEAERQALALLDHPNIAHVLNAGATDAGRPYFAMEYVKGVPITEHCDRYRLTIKERLALFLAVCEAVQHAHQKGIIHRDIKPSNILVSFEEQRALAKVIDFGIAKAIGQPLTDRTLCTERGQLVGTLEYMSPEQAEMTSQDIDTRSDIYSLGVVLYELLTGMLPFESSTLREGGADHLRQVIREQDPKAPSTRVSHLTEEDGTRIADRRRSDAGALHRRLRGDLDWITLKAMEKDRARRYGSAGELAADIRRHLNDEPVTAGPPSTLYRVCKYVRRHRALTTGLAAVFLVFLAGMAGIMVFAVKADRQARTAQAVVDFVDQDLLGSVALQQAMSQEVTVRSILDAASNRLEGRFADRPLVEAAIRLTLGKTYIELGDCRQAEPHVKRAYDIRRRELGDNDPLTLTSMAQLGRLYWMRARYPEAEPLLTRALEFQRRILGADHLDTVETSVWLGRLYTEICRPELPEKAETLLNEARESSHRLFGGNSPLGLEAGYGLAFLHVMVEGKFEEAEPAFGKGWEIAKEQLGEGHRLTCQFMVMLALFKASNGWFDEAEDLARKALAMNRRVLGEEHPDTLNAMCTLGVVYALRNDLEDAEPLLEPGIARLRIVLGEGQGMQLFYSRWLAGLYLSQRRYQEAQEVLERIMTEGGPVLGDDHILLTLARMNILTLYAMQEKGEELENWSAQEIRELQRKPGHSDLAEADMRNALAWIQATYPSPAVRNGPEAEANATIACGLTGRNNPLYLDTLAAAHAEAGHFETAAAQEQNAIDLCAKLGSSGVPAGVDLLRYHLKRFKAQQAVREGTLTGPARQRVAQKRYEAAEQELAAAMKVAQRYLGETHPETRGCILGFIELYEAWSKPEEAEKWRAKLPTDE